MTDEDAVLVATDVGHSFGNRQVLSDVTMSVNRGRVTAIIGANGSGKTTLLRILAGVLTQTTGTVDYRGPAAESGREIGYMPQQPEFRSGFTARETLEFYTALADGDPERLLERVGLGGAGDRRVEALSGGMRRLLGIAQATVGDPPVVILDEPGSGLDPGMRRRAFEVVRDLAEAGKTVLLSSHDMLFTEQFADSVLVLDSGQIVVDGTPVTLREEFGAESLQEAFEAAVPRETDTIEAGGESE